MANNISRFAPISDLARLDPFGNIDDLFSGFMFRPVFRGMEAEPQIKKEKEEKEGKRVICSERYCGKVCRSFTLESILTVRQDWRDCHAGKTGPFS